ncbi:hypothetical protein [Arthrobacter sp. UYCu511]|uniref:hypothetical protein n=1 Tax=Arthrobacter sp. UYCu511 TaxID=3156337 RepID=UPI0033941D10
MKMGDLLNKTYTVEILNVPYYGPTLAERSKNMKMDQGFKRSQVYLKRMEDKRAETEGVIPAAEPDAVDKA